MDDRHKLLAVFRACDPNFRGTIDRKPLEAAMKSVLQSTDTDYDWLSQKMDKFVDKPTGGVLYEQFAAWLSAKTPDVALRLELGNSNLYKILPGLGSEDFPGFSTGACPEQLPDLSSHRSLAAQVLRQNDQIFPRLRDRRTGLGATLARCIKPCMDHPSLQVLGLAAGDRECYEAFRDLFDPVLQGCHPWLSRPAAAPPSAPALRDGPIDPEGQHVTSVRVSCSRNLDGLRFPPACSRAERRKVEALLVKALAQLGTRSPEGRYYPLAHSTTNDQMPDGMTPKDEEYLETLRVLFREPQSKDKLSAGLGRDWPEARGVFFVASQGLAAWINQEDHLQLVSMQEGGDLKSAYQHLAKALEAVEGSLRLDGHKFAHDGRLGYLTACPSSLGLRAVVTMQLPALAGQPGLQETCQQLGLRARSFPAARGSDALAREVTNVDQMAAHEYEVVNATIDGCNRLVGEEIRRKGAGS